MKKSFLGFMLVVMSVFMFSCEKEDKMNNTFNSKSSTTLEILKEFNDSLSVDPACETKGFLRFIAVASADVTGAYELGKIGVKIGALGGLKGALIGGAIGGIIGGVGASYGAYCGTKPETASTLDFPTVNMLVTNYSYVTISDSLLFQYTEDDIKLNFPEEFNDEAIRTGKMHNLILDISIDEGELQNIDNQLTDMEKSVIYSDEFLCEYDKIINNFIDLDLEDPEYIYADGTVESSVMQLFLDIYNKYPENCEDVNFIINKYIEVVDDSDEISDEMKSCIYNGLAVAAYSYKYWEEGRTGIFLN